MHRGKAFSVTDWRAGVLGSPFPWNKNHAYIIIFVPSSKVIPWPARRNRGLPSPQQNQGGASYTPAGKGQDD